MQSVFSIGFIFNDNNTLDNYLLGYLFASCVITQTNDL